MSHPHPTHIDIPPRTDPEVAEDDLLSASPKYTPSSTRPAPSRGILKNPLRRPSEAGGGVGSGGLLSGVPSDVDSLAQAQANAQGQAEVTAGRNDQERERERDIRPRGPQGEQ
jgi:hypothetical protein